MTTEIAICLTSHDRLDCVRINQEIFKLNFRHPYTVVHACSGAGAAAYLEDAFVRCDPRPHFAGAFTLMREALAAARRFRADFFVLLEGDTWLLDEDILLGLIRRMQDDPALLMAACAWMTPPDSPVRRLAREIDGLARFAADRLQRLVTLPRRLRYDAVDFGTQFFIMRNEPPLLDLFCGMSPDGRRMLERQWFERFSAYFSFKRVLRLREREPVHPYQRFACEALALHSEHWPAAGTYAGGSDTRALFHVEPRAPGKREALEHYSRIRRGESIQRLLRASCPADLAYYNKGAHRF